MAPSGSAAATAAARPAAVSAPVGRSGRARVDRRRRVGADERRRARRGRRRRRRRARPARAPRSRPARGRSACPDRRRTTPASRRRRARGGAAPSSCACAMLGEVLQLLDGRDAGAALGAGDERLGEQPGAGAGGDAGRGGERARAAAPIRRAAARPARPSAAPWRRCSTTSASTGARRPAPAAGATGSAPSLHDTSAGRISVATWPGGPARRGDGLGGDPAQLGRCARAGRSSPTRCVPRRRCRSAAGRRSGRGTWRGRRRC